MSKPNSDEQSVFNSWLSTCKTVYVFMTRQQTSSIVYRQIQLNDYLRLSAVQKKKLPTIPQKYRPEETQVLPASIVFSPNDTCRYHPQCLGQEMFFQASYMVLLIKELKTMHYLKIQLFQINQTLEEEYVGVKNKEVLLDHQLSCMLKIE